MNLVKTLCMVLCIVLLGWYFSHLEHATDAPQSVTEGEEAILPEAKSKEIASVVVGLTDEFYTLDRSKQDQKKDQLWSIKNPEAHAADQLQVAELIKTLGNLKSQNIISKEEAGSERKLFGFDKPSLSLSVHFEGADQPNSPALSDSVELVFGNRHTFSGRRYLQRLQDERVFLVSETSFLAIAKRTNELRDSTPLEFDYKDGVSEVFASYLGGETLQFFKSKEAGDWIVRTTGRTVRVDEEVFLETFARLSQSKVSEFIDRGVEKKEVYGLAKPKLTLLIKFESQRGTDSELSGEPPAESSRVAVSFGEVNSSESAGAPKKFYFSIEGDPTVYESSGRIYSDFLQGIDHFRDRRPFARLKFEDLKSIEISKKSENGVPFRLVPTQGNNWKIAHGDTEEAADSARATAFVAAIKKFTVLSYPGDEYGIGGKFGFTSSEMGITVSTEKWSRRLNFGSLVESADGDEEQNPDRPTASKISPRFIQVEVENGMLIPAIVGWESWSALEQGRSYFLAKPR